MDMEAGRVGAMAVRRPAVIGTGRYARPRFSEALFGTGLYLAGGIIVAMLLAILITLVVASFPAIRKIGFQFVTGSVWDPVAGEFGALPFLVGTLLTSFLALAISLVFSLAISITLGEYFRKGVLSSLIKSIVELLAGIPSVIYGFWALSFLVPMMRFMELKIGVSPYGVGILTASIILAIMIVPYAASLGREVISLVPADLKEAGFSLGATRFEVVRKIVLPHARSGITAGVLLSLGRALGETMAVTMVIGNSNMLPASLFAPGNTMASIIANEFTEATGALYLASLIEIALVLFVVTAIINIIGKIVIMKMSVSG